MNKEWMDNYEKNYTLYKEEWDSHYEEIRNFIHSCLPHRVSHWGFIGVTNTIPEFDDRILNRISKITLLDINDMALKRARIHLASVYEFLNVDVQRFDNTIGFIDEIIEGFNKLESQEFTEKKLLEYLNQLEPPKDKDIVYPNSQDNNRKYDFITHLGLMDYYLIPLFTKYCSSFPKNVEEFYQTMKKLNDQSVRITLGFLHHMLDKNGSLIISTPVARDPEGESCKRSIFWLDSIETIIEESNFVIINKTEHIWKEFPVEGGHSHLVMNICCEKKKKE
ncbi:MAG: hypothetical protein ACTSQF_06815 [Candidatus Heimdallarchaeaceae archaeon]